MAGAIQQEISELISQIEGRLAQCFSTEVPQVLAALLAPIDTDINAATARVGFLQSLTAEEPQKVAALKVLKELVCMKLKTMNRRAVHQLVSHPKMLYDQVQSDLVHYYPGGIPKPLVSLLEVNTSEIEVTLLENAYAQLETPPNGAKLDQLQKDLKSLATLRGFFLDAYRRDSLNKAACDALSMVDLLMGSFSDGIPEPMVQCLSPINATMKEVMARLTRHSPFPREDDLILIEALARQKIELIKEYL